MLPQQWPSKYFSLSNVNRFCKQNMISCCNTQPCFGTDKTSQNPKAESLPTSSRNKSNAATLPHPTNNQWTWLRTQSGKPLTWLNLFRVNNSSQRHCKTKGQTLKTCCNLHQQLRVNSRSQYENVKETIHQRKPNCSNVSLLGMRMEGSRTWKVGVPSRTSIYNRSHHKANTSGGSKL